MAIKLKDKGIIYYIRLIFILAAGAFHLYTASFGIWVSQKPLHLTLFLAICFLTEMEKALKIEGRAKRNALFLLYTLCFFASLTVGVYIIKNYSVLTTRLGQGYFYDTLMGTVMLALILVFAQRCLGWTLPIIALIFILYARFGQYFPGLLQHRGFRFERLVTYIPFSSDGIMGSALSASAKFVTLYLIFAATLEVCGGGQFFIDFANSLMGHRRGGPAKAAVISSALMGSISGSAIANVAGTGAFTIPLMKKSGYQPEFAGAVESAASTGGQFTPPVMASAAFIMAELLGVSYGEIISVAILPAFLYYFAVFINVDIEAKKNRLTGLPRETLPQMLPLLKTSGYLLLPVILMVVVLGAFHYSAQRAGIYAIAISIILSWIKKETRIGLKQILSIIDKGIQNSVSVVAACGCSGIIVGVVTGTGLGSVLTRLVTQLSNGHLGIALIFTMIATIILGMGMPTIPAYLIPAVMLAPVLIDLGANKIAAHLFILFFASMSGITPPVALTSFTAAGLAGSNFWKTSLVAFEIAIAGFTVPYVFVFQPGLLLQGPVLGIAQAFIVCALGLLAIAASFRGMLLCRLNMAERAALMVCGVLLIDTNVITDIIGLGILGLVCGMNFLKNKREKEAAAG